MLFIKKLLIRGALSSISPPINELIDTNKQSLLLEKGLSKLGWRSIRRLAPLRLNNQKKYLLAYIEPKKHKKCLWLYYDAPQIGDALMDLAPRSILHQLGIQIDLFTHQHIVELFAGDQLFNAVESDPELINPEDYDFAIVTNFTWKAIKHKFLYARLLPLISIYEEFTGPEINRALFTTKKLAELTKQKISLKEQEFHATQKLILANDKPVNTGSFKSVALAIGGVDKNRIFSNWNLLIKELYHIGIEEIVLLGGHNGITEANTIKNYELEIQNFVGKTSLIECRKLMQKATIVIAADGGLMHLAVTTDTPVLSLFNNAIKPNWRLPSHLVKHAIQSKSNDLNDIEVATIINAIKNII